MQFEVEMNQVVLVLVPAKVGQILIHCPAFGLAMDRWLGTFYQGRTGIRTSVRDP
jgi:hypothetical protein